MDLLAATGDLMFTIGRAAAAVERVLWALPLERMVKLAATVVLVDMILTSLTEPVAVAAVVGMVIRGIRARAVREAVRQVILDQHLQPLQHQTPEAVVAVVEIPPEVKVVLVSL
jgi:hypothetical protein